LFFFVSVMLYAVILIYNVFLIVGFWVLKKEFF